MQETGRHHASRSIQKFRSENEIGVCCYRDGGAEAVLTQIFQNSSALARMIESNKQLQSCTANNLIDFFY